MKSRKLTTRGLFLGSVDADMENRDEGVNLSNCFVDEVGIADAINHGRFLICGRKGSGKSAYAVHQKRRDSITEQIHTSIVHKEDFALEHLLNNNDADEKNRPVLFEWMILVRLVKLIIDSEIGATNQLVKSLGIFYEKNSGWVRIDRYTIDEIIKGDEINFSPLKGNFSIFRKLFKTKEIKAPFYKMIAPLRDAVSQVLRMDIFSQAEFKVIFDDLDVKFKLTHESDKEMLIDLIRIVKRYNTEYLLDTKAMVIMLLRDDISDRLEGIDCDVAKTISAMSHKIKWYVNDTYGDGRNTPLRNMFNKRLIEGYKELGIDWSKQPDPWSEFVTPIIENKASFKYILDHTFYLPRDLMAIFKDIGSRNYTLPLGEEQIRVLLSDFSFEKKKEIADELTALYTTEEINDIFLVLNKISQGFDVTYDNILDYLKQYGFDEPDLINLIDYNLIVPVDPIRNHFYFSYRERIPRNGIKGFTFRTPYILSLYFKHR